MPFFRLGDFILKRIHTLLGVCILISLIAPIHTSYTQILDTKNFEDPSVRIDVDRITTITYYSSVVFNFSFVSDTSYNLQVTCKTSLTLVSHELGEDTLESCFPNTTIIWPSANSSLTLKTKRYLVLIRLAELFKV